MQPDKEVTLSEAATILNRPYATLLNHIHTGDFRTARKSGKTWMVNLRDVDHELSARRVRRRSCQSKQKAYQAYQARLEQKEKCS